MDEAKEEATDGVRRVASLFATSLVGGLAAVGGVAQAALCRRQVHGASAEARERRARCLELGFTREELARLEGGR